MNKRYLAIGLSLLIIAVIPVISIAKEKSVVIKQDTAPQTFNFMTGEKGNTINTNCEYDSEEWLQCLYKYKQCFRVCVSTDIPVKNITLPSSIPENTTVMVRQTSNLSPLMENRKMACILPKKEGLDLMEKINNAITEVQQYKAEHPDAEEVNLSELKAFTKYNSRINKYKEEGYCTYTTK